MRKINESIQFNHPLRKNVDTILRKVRHQLIWTYGCGCIGICSKSTFVLIQIYSSVQLNIRRRWEGTWITMRILMINKTHTPLKEAFQSYTSRYSFTWHTGLILICSKFYSRVTCFQSSRWSTPCNVTIEHTFSGRSCLSRLFTWRTLPGTKPAPLDSLFTVLPFQKQ